MPFEIVTIPCLSDNYAFLAHDPASGTTTLIDVPEAAPIAATLRAHDWSLDQVLLTHHHADHVQGLGEILAAYPAQVIGAARDAHRLPPLDRAVEEGDTVEIGGEKGQVIDVSGHTIGHIAFHFPDSHAAFTADSLMALGCGRVFEGTMEMMFDSLSKLAALPPETILFSGHEYTFANAKFAMTIEPGNSALISRMSAIEAARQEGRPTVPSTLSEELATNPFLRAHIADVAEAVGLPDAPSAEVFATVRKRKDSF